MRRALQDIPGHVGQAGKAGKQIGKAGNKMQKVRALRGCVPRVCAIANPWEFRRAWGCHGLSGQAPVLYLSRLCRDTACSPLVTIPTRCCPDLLICASVQ